MEPIFLLYDGRLERPDGDSVLEVELEGVRSRLWRVEGDPPDVLADARLLIADGHHRYETTLAYHAEEGTEESAWLLVVVVPTEQEGLTIFPTHRIAERLGPVDGERPFDGELPADRSAAVIYRASGTTVVTGEPGEPDTALVDRLGLDGVTYTPSEEEAKAAVDSGAAQAAVLVRPPSVDLVRELAERGETMPQKSTYFFPKLPSGLFFHAAVTDWLELCRAAAAEVEGVLAELPTRDERERVVGAGEGGDDTTAIDDAAERAVVAVLDAAGHRLRARERGARPPRRHRGRRGHGRARPHRRLDQREARHPVLLPLACSGRGPDDGGRRLRVRPRLRLGGGVVGGPRRRRKARRRTLDAPLPKEQIELLGLEATKTVLVAEHAPALTPIAERLRVMGSLALSLCHLAAGRVDAVASLRPASSVDIAAAQLVALERGVTVELFDEPPLAAAPLDLVPRSRLAAAATPGTPARGSPTRCAEYDSAMRTKLAAVAVALLVAPVAGAAVGIKATLKAPATEPKVNVKWPYSIKVTDLKGKADPRDGDRRCHRPARHGSPGGLRAHGPAESRAARSRSRTGRSRARSVTT